MAKYEVSDADAATIAAILMTHAEMQDMRSVQSMEIAGRLARDEPEAAVDLLESLGDQIETFDDDCDALRRIARIFGNA